MSKTRDTWREPEAPVCPSRLSHEPPAMAEATSLEKWCTTLRFSHANSAWISLLLCTFLQNPPLLLQPSVALCGAGLFFVASDRRGSVLRSVSSSLWISATFEEGDFGAAVQVRGVFLGLPRVGALFHFAARVSSCLGSRDIVEPHPHPTFYLT